MTEHLTPAQQKAVARARSALETARGERALPPGHPYELPSNDAYWRGWLDNALEALLAELEDEGPRYSDQGPGVAMDGGGMISGASRWPPHTEAGG